MRERRTRYGASQYSCSVDMALDSLDVSGGGTYVGGQTNNNNNPSLAPKVKKPNFSHPGFEPKTCPLREQAADQLSQSEVIYWRGCMIVLDWCLEHGISLPDAQVFLVSKEGILWRGVINLKQLCNLKSVCFKLKYFSSRSKSPHESNKH